MSSPLLGNLRVAAVAARGDAVLSEATVKTHVKRVLSKLGLRDRVQALVLACESALVMPGVTP